MDLTLRLYIKEQDIKQENQNSCTTSQIFSETGDIASLFVTLLKGGSSISSHLDKYNKETKLIVSLIHTLNNLELLTEYKVKYGTLFAKLMNNRRVLRDED